VPLEVSCRVVLQFDHIQILSHISSLVFMLKSLDMCKTFTSRSNIPVSKFALWVNLVSCR